MKNCTISRILLPSIIGLLVTAVACGGGGGSSTVVSPPPPPPAVFQVTTGALLGTVGVPFNATLTAANGTPPFKWSVGGSAGQPPPGITLTEAGVLSGMPTTAGTILKQINVTDSSTPPKTATKDISFDLFGVNSPQFKSGQVDEAYQTDWTASGGTLPLRYSLVGGSLPIGMSLKILQATSTRETLFLFGVPSQPGDFAMTIHAEDSSTPPRAVNFSGTVHVANGILTFLEVSLPHAVAGSAYTHQVAFKGGVPPYSWSITRNPDLLPTGINLNPATGVISGTTTQAGFATFMLTVSDSNSPQQAFLTRTFSLLSVPHELPARNDSIATATPVAPGFYEGSISPISVGSGADQDYYELTMQGGTIIDVVVGAEGFRVFETPTLIPVLEIVDQNGARHSTCNDPADDSVPAGAPIATDTTPLGFDDPCMNTPIFDPSPVSRLTFKVPGSGSTTFYLHVFDVRGDARPNSRYRMQISAH